MRRSCKPSNLRLLQAVVAVAFALLFAAQPGLFAFADASGMHETAMAGTSLDDPAPRVEAGHSHHDAEMAGLEDDMAFDHHGNSLTDDKSCEVHCAPAQAMPVDCPAMAAPLRDCFEPDRAASLPYGLSHEFIQPPRT